MRTSHELLLKYRFDRRFVFSDVEVWYVDRGVPGDLSCVNGVQISVLGSFVMEIQSDATTKHIPYHRIRKILYAGENIWQR